jgi:hypothetical protein
MGRRRKATRYEVTDIWIGPDVWSLTAWITVPGLTSPVCYQRRRGSDVVTICKYPYWDKLTVEERDELGAQLTIALMNDSRYQAQVPCVIEDFSKNRP